MQYHCCMQRPGVPRAGQEVLFTLRIFLSRYRTSLLTRLWECGVIQPPEPGAFSRAVIIAPHQAIPKYGKLILPEQRLISLLSNIRSQGIFTGTTIQGMTIGWPRDLPIRMASVQWSLTRTYSSSVCTSTPAEN